MDINYADLLDGELDTLIQDAVTERTSRQERKRFQAWERVAAAIQNYVKSFGTITCKDEEGNAMYLDEDISFNCDYERIVIKNSEINY